MNFICVPSDNDQLVLSFDAEWQIQEQKKDEKHFEKRVK
jgi:hypothetical protein